MPHSLRYAVVAAVATAVLATSPAPARPLAGGSVAPSPQARAHHRDLFYDNTDAFTVRPIPTTAPPAAPRPVADTPPARNDDTNGSLLIGLGLVGAGVAAGAAGAVRRRRVSV